MQRGKISFFLLVLLVVAFFGGAEAKADVNDANNWGYLNIDVRLVGKQLNSSMGIGKDDRYYPGTSDGLDYMDVEQTLFMPNRSGGFVDIENKKRLSNIFSVNSFFF